MRILRLTACVMVAAAASAARMPAQTSASVIAVTLDVSVLDGAGRPVPGLAAAEFSVELDGQPRRVVAVTYFPSGPPMAGALGPAFDAVTAAPPAYRLVVQPPDDTPANREFALTVRVTRAGTKIQAPPRVAAAPVMVTGTPAAAAASPPKSADERLRSAIASGRPERGLPIQIGRAVRQDKDARLRLELQIDIGGPARGPLRGLLGLVDSRGVVRTASPQIEPAAAGAYRVELSMPLEAGAYRVRFAAVDAAGAFGSSEVPVTAQVTAVGPLAASDLLRWTADANGRRLLLVEELPPGVTAIGATLELYAPAGAALPGDLLVKMEFAGIERIVTPEWRDGVLVADAEFPLERIGSGTHLMRAAVWSGSTTLGTVAATLIKR